MFSSVQKVLSNGSGMGHYIRIPRAYGKRVICGSSRESASHFLAPLIFAILYPVVAFCVCGTSNLLDQECRQLTPLCFEVLRGQTAPAGLLCCVCMSVPQRGADLGEVATWGSSPGSITFSQCDIMSPRLHALVNKIACKALELIT